MASKKKHPKHPPPRKPLTVAALRAELAKMPEVEELAPIEPVFADMPNALEARSIRRYTLAEVKRQTLRVERLMLEGATAEQIHLVLGEPDPANGIAEFPKISLIRIKHLVGRIAQRWLEIQKERESPDGVRLMRYASIQRLQELRRWAMTPDPKTKKVNDAAALSIERAIMRLQGTEAPLKVDHSGLVGVAVNAVVGNLSNERAEEWLREMEELERRALPPKVIDVQVVPTDPRGSVAGAESSGE